ncbi:MAG TPA: polysaccharide deacetylase family protein [Bryobacteraceae bacterium]|nr:polysaccharide deacetylase family protein [Bryobacteraceae bacterium]
MPSAKVTLTFDNGPEAQVTPGVLDLLARYHIRATFFVMGRKAVTKEGRELIGRAIDEGHWIGNHTYTHAAALGRLDRATALREFEQAEQALAWIEQPRRLFRPPGSGELGRHLLQPAIVDRLVAGSYTCVLWNSVPGDYRDPDGWLERAMADCRSRSWTLMALHDIPNGAMAHLDEFLARLKGGGFELTQEFPPDCLPIVEGKVILPLEPYETVG